MLRAVAVDIFFLQAEDGIRDLIVTGVKTCALPISSRRRHPRSDRDWSSDVRSEEHTSELQSRSDLVCRLLLEIGDRKSTRLNSSHDQISYAVFCLKKKKIKYPNYRSICSVQARPYM